MSTFDPSAPSDAFEAAWPEILRIAHPAAYHVWDAGASAAANDKNGAFCGMAFDAFLAFEYACDLDVQPPWSRAAWAAGLTALGTLVEAIDREYPPVFPRTYGY